LIDYDYIRSSLKAQDTCNDHFLERYLKTVHHWEGRQEDILPEEFPQYHHIVPKWMGGEDSPKNLIKVPVRIHLYLHKLLFQMTRTKASLCSVMIFSKTADMRNTQKAKHIFMNVQSYLSTVVYEDYIETQSSLTKGKVWMTDGENDTRVDKDNVPDLIAKGWDFGRSNKSIKNKLMTFDLEEDRWVKIDLEVAKSNPERYQTGVTRCWDSSDQPNFPYIKLTGKRQEEIDRKDNLRCPSELVRLDDGRYIHQDYFTDSMTKWSQKRKTPNHRWKGIYHTPYGDFVNIWTFERETKVPHNRPESWCRKKCDQPVDPRSPFYDEDNPTQTYRDMGWSFTPKDQVTDEMLDKVIGLHR